MINIICPISSDEALTKNTRKSINLLRCEKKVVYPKGYDIGNQMSSEIDLSIPEHLFVDSDIEFTEKDLEILRTSECDVVSAAYKKSVSNGRIVGNKSWLHEDGNAFVAGWWGSQIGLIDSMVSIDCTAMMKVDWCGTGFLYCKTSALKKIIDNKNEPVFYNQTIKTEKSKYGVIQTSPDIGFSINCQKSGIQIWLNCGVQVQHIRR